MAKYVLKKKRAYKPKPKKNLTKRVYPIGSFEALHSPVKKKKSLPKQKKLVSANWYVEEPHGTIVLVVPIHTVSEANKKEYWLTAAKRHTKQKKILKEYFHWVKKLIFLPCSVTMIRMAPRALDQADNLPMSLKWLIDGVCEELTGNYAYGRADSDPRIQIFISQEKSKEYGVKIKFDMTPYHLQLP